MKQKVLIALLCIAFIVPVCTVAAQEEEEQRPTVEAVLEQSAPQEAVQEAQESSSQEQKPQAAQQKAAPKKDAPLQLPKVEIPKVSVPKARGAVTVWIKRIISFISQIGGLFGNTFGFRIGGTTVTAVLTLFVAKMLEDKLPQWVKYLLYATGGTMFAGSGANITKLVMQVFGG